MTRHKILWSLLIGLWASLTATVVYLAFSHEPPVYQRTINDLLDEKDKIHNSLPSLTHTDTLNTRQK